MENADEIKFKILVPFNDKMVVHNRNKILVFGGFFTLLAGIIFCAVLINLIKSNTKEVDNSVLYLGIGVILFFLLSSIFLFSLTIRRKKNDNKFFELNFYDVYIDIYRFVKAETEKKNAIRACLYRPYGSKQHVSKVVEDATKFSIKICVGSVNFMTTYETQIVPKIYLGGKEQLFAEFLQARVGDKNYRVK